MFNKVNSVFPLENYTLLVTFSDNTKRIYDVKPLFNKWTCFKDLQEISGLFECVSVDVGGYGISWNDDLDLSCNELYENSNLIN